jgi:type III secretion system YscI/HrpB-like protein
MSITSAQLIAQKALAAAAQPQAPAAGPADAAQAAHFRALLNAGAADPAQAVAVQPAAAGDPAILPAERAVAAQPGRPASIGDAILQGLDKVRSSLDENLTQAQSLIDPDGGPMSTARLLGFQMSMLHMGFQYQMVAGVVTKTAQNIDQLVKMQ